MDAKQTSIDALTMAQFIGTLWVVDISQGQYSDRHECMLCWYLREEDARAHATALNERFKEWVIYRAALLKELPHTKTTPQYMTIYEYECSVEYEKEVRTFFGKLLPAYDRDSLPRYAAGIDMSDDSLYVGVTALPPGFRLPEGTNE